MNVVDFTARRSYDHHAGVYRNVQVPNTWQWSPVSTTSLPMSPMKPVFELPQRNPPVLQPHSPSSNASTLITTTKPNGSSKIKQILGFLRDMFLKPPPKPQLGEPSAIPPPLEKDIEVDRVRPEEWKQYAYWSRPQINQVPLPNSPATSEKTVDTAFMYEMVDNIHDQGEVAWVPGVKHRSIPPRPTRWTIPVPGEPLPFPWEVQINPLLQHILWGPSPLSWYIGSNPYEILYYGCTSEDIRASSADLVQPATWPFLTHMYVNAVLGDNFRRFPWPFTIYNPRGIRLGDVLWETYQNLSMPLSDEELSSLPALRKEAAKTAYDVRLKQRLFYDILPHQDVMRRYDSFGGNMYFKGMEASVDGCGWMLVFGPY